MGGPPMRKIDMHKGIEALGLKKGTKLGKTEGTYGLESCQLHRSQIIGRFE
jgi:hypothetical protein